MLVDSCEVRTQLTAIAAETYRLGLQSQRSGNLSVRIEPGSRFLITRTGSKMGNLNPSGDFVLAEVHGVVPPAASSEALVHQRIYQLTNRNAVLHTHPPCAIAIAMAVGGIPLVFNEARAAFKDERAVVVVNSTTASEGGEDPGAIGAGFVGSEVVMVNGHGLFVASEDVDTCLYLSSLLEINAKIFSVAERHGGPARGQ